MIQFVNPDLSVTAHNTPRPHIKRLADLYRQLPEHQEERYRSLIVGEAKKTVDVF
jgi:hypothetical protein